jgi:hypothetical protein
MENCVSEVVMDVAIEVSGVLLLILVMYSVWRRQHVRVVVKVPCGCVIFEASDSHTD